MFMYEGVCCVGVGGGTLGCLCTRVYDVWVWGREHWDVHVRGCMMCGCGGREHWDVYVRGCTMCGCGGEGTLGCLCMWVYDVWVWGEGTLGCLCTRVYDVWVWGEGTLGCLCTRVYDVWVWGEGTLGCLCTRVSPSPCRIMCGCGGREHWDVYVCGCMMCGCGGMSVIIVDDHHVSAAVCRGRGEVRVR